MMCSKVEQASMNLTVGKAMMNCLVEMMTTYCWEKQEMTGCSGSRETIGWNPVRAMTCLKVVAGTMFFRRVTE